MLSFCKTMLVTSDSSSSLILSESSFYVGESTRQVLLHHCGFHPRKFQSLDRYVIIAIFPNEKSLFFIIPHVFIYIQIFETAQAYMNKINLKTFHSEEIKKSKQNNLSWPKLRYPKTFSPRRSGKTLKWHNINLSVHPTYYYIYLNE